MSQLKELIIGFDARDMTNIEHELKSWRENGWLINPKITHVLSLNTEIWTSIFKRVFTISVPPRTDYPIEIFAGELTQIGLWDDFEEMQSFILNKNIGGRFWSIGISIVETQEYLYTKVQHEMEQGWLLNVKNDSPNPHWKLLGYDVLDSIFRNKGLNSGFVGEFEEQRRRLWGEMVNQYYLFSDQNAAVDYAKWHLSQEPGIGASLLVFGIYLISKHPK